MIDLHAHVLPGLGEEDRCTLAQVLALLGDAAADGTRVVVATPHLRARVEGHRPEATAAAVARLMRHVPAAWDIVVLPGAELDLRWAVEATADELRAASIAGRGADLLVETPCLWLPEDFEEQLAAVRARGYRVTLSHPELSPVLQQDPDRLVGLVACGTLLQLTAASLAADPRRSAAARLARRLVGERLAHVIASGTHPGDARRPPRLADAVAVAGRLAPERARWMVGPAPAAIVAGRALPPVPALAGAVAA